MAAENVLEIKINDETPPAQGGVTSVPTPTPFPLPLPYPRPTAFNRDIEKPQGKAKGDEPSGSDQDARLIAGLVSSKLGIPPQFSQLLLEALKPAKPKEPVAQAPATPPPAPIAQAPVVPPERPERPAQPQPTPAPGVPQRLSVAPPAPPQTNAIADAKGSQPLPMPPPAPVVVEAPVAPAPVLPATTSPPPKPVVVQAPEAKATLQASPALPIVKPAATQPAITPPPPKPVLAPAPATPAAAPAAAGGLNAAMALAGGPVGLAIAAAEIIEGKVNELYAGVEKGIRGLGTVAAQVAGNDGLGALKSATGAATGAMESIPIVGEGLARGFKLMVAGVEAYSQVIMALTRRGQELAEYDSRLALASAEAEVSKVYADLREAQRNGETMSRLIKAQSRIEIATQDNFSRIKDTLSRALAPGLERLANVFEKVEPLLEAQFQIWDTVIETNNKVHEVMDKANNALAKVLERLGVDIPTGQKKQNPQDEAEELMNGLLGMVNDLDLGGNADPVPDEWKETVSSPLFR